MTGLGALTPLGNNVQKSWARLIKSECGITKLQGSQFDILPVKIAGLIPDFDAASWQGLKEYKV